MRFRVRFKFTLLALLSIVISLLAVSIVSASISVHEIVGIGGVNYRAANDTIGINVTSTSEASVGSTPCVSSGTTNNYVCIITDSTTGVSSSYQIKNIEGNTASATIKVDNTIGTISYTTINTNGVVTLDYTIRDTGFNSNALCSGIKSFSVYDGSTELNTLELNGAVGECTYTGSANLTVSGSGTKAIVLKVTDNVGNIKTTPSQNITLDLSPPEIINGLTLKQSGSTSELDVVSSSAVFYVDVYFSVRETNLASITIDLSDINNNPAAQYAYKNFNVPINNCVLSNDSESDDVKVYNCVVRAVQMKLPDEDLIVNVTVKDTFGAEASSDLTKLFTIDNTIPQVSMKTDRCDTSGRCYIHNGENHILISLTKDNFQKQLVFFTISGSTLGTNRIQNCSGSECTANVQLTCSSGSQVDVSISTSGGFSSQDDSGNIIPPYNTYFYCDNTPPKIEDINVTGQTSTVIAELVSGSTIDITTSIREAETSELYVNVWLDKLKNSSEDADCEKISDTHFKCKLNVANIDDGYYDAEIVVNATDIVGNNAQMSKRVKVFGFKSDNETPNNLGIKLNQIYPKKINRIVLDMATGNSIPFYVYATYNLNVERGNDISALYQSIDIARCVYRSESGEVPASSVFSDAKISNAYGKIGEISRVDLAFPDNTDPNILDDEFEIICNISVIVKEGNLIYKNPQQLELKMPFKLENTKLCDEGQECTPGERLGKKIEEAENNFLVRAKILGIVGSIIPKVQQICNVRGYMTQGTAASTILSMASNAVAINTGNAKIGEMPISLSIKLFNLDACFSGSGRGYGSGVHDSRFDQFGNQGNSYNPSYNSAQYNSPYGNNGAIGNNGAMNSQQTQQDMINLAQQNREQRANIANKCQEIVGKACDFLSCSATEDAQKLIDDDRAKQNEVNRAKFGKTDVTVVDNKNAFGERSMDILTKDLDVPDYRNSALMAAKEGCWPAVLYNVNKWRQAECNYVYCLKMAAYSGTDISACDKAKHTQQCSLFVGEVFESVPVARYYKNLAENAADYVHNLFPLAASSLLHKTVCPSYTNAESVLSGEKLEAPKTIGQQTAQIYGCQLPIQIARLADSNLRSNMRGGGNFQYPELPDMCIYAECVGEENCEYEPDFWTTLNQMRLFTNKQRSDANKINVDRNKQVAEGNVKLNKIGHLRQLGNDLQKTPEEGKYTQVYQSKVDEYNRLLKEFHDNGEFNSLDTLGSKKVETTTSYILSDGKKITPNAQGYYGDQYYNNYQSFPGSDDRFIYYPKNPQLSISQDRIVNVKTGKVLTMDEFKATDDFKKYGDTIVVKDLKPEFKETKETTVTNNYATTPADLEKIKSQYADYRNCLSKSNYPSTPASNVGAGATDQCTDILRRVDVTETPKDRLDALSFDPTSKTNKLDIVESRNALVEQSKALDDLAYMDSVLDVNGVSMVSNDPTKSYNVHNPWGSTPLTNQQLQQKRLEYYKNLGFCGGSGPPTCAEYNDKLQASDGAALKEHNDKINAIRNSNKANLNTYNREVRNYDGSVKFGNALYTGLQYLNANKMLEWMYTDYWTEKWFGDKFSNYIDPTKWKESLCNPLNPINTGRSSTDSAVISCSSGICRPVLTYTAEKTILENPNGTKYYIYTAVYYISGGDLRGRDTKYNVRFYSNNVLAKTIKGFKDDVKLQAFDTVQKKTVFTSPLEYDEMCIEFDKPFPPDNSIENSYKYCRQIKENAFSNNGSPWTPEEEEAGAAGYTNQYDARGNRVRTSGTNTNTADEEPPGVFESDGG